MSCGKNGCTICCPSCCACHADGEYEARIKLEAELLALVPQEEHADLYARLDKATLHTLVAEMAAERLERRR